MYCVFLAILLTCSLGTAFGNAADQCPVHNVDFTTYGIDLLALYDQDVRGGHPGLACIGHKIITDAVPSYNFHQSDKLFNFLKAIEASYRPATDVAYHNGFHGLDVLQTAYSLMMQPKIKDSFTPAEKLALLIAAAGHDVDHPGLNNAFLRKLNDKGKWNQEPKVQGWTFAEPPLEQRHWSIIDAKLTESSLLAGIDGAQAIKDLIRDLVLYTDASRGSGHVVPFGAPQGTVAAEEQALKDFVQARKSLTDPTNRKFVLKTIIHLADVSNPTKTREFSMKMAGRVSKEFFLQGAKEVNDLAPPSVGCDPAGVNSIGTSQVGFIDSMVKNIWELFAELVHRDSDPTPTFIRNLNDNHAYYASHRGLKLDDIYPNCCPTN